MSDRVYIPETLQLKQLIAKHMQEGNLEANEWLSGYGAWPVAEDDQRILEQEKEDEKLSETLKESKKCVNDYLKLAEAFSAICRKNKGGWFFVYKRCRKDSLVILNIALRNATQTMMNRCAKHQDIMRDGLARANREAEKFSGKIRWLEAHIEAASCFLEERPEAGARNEREWVPGVGDIGQIRMPPRIHLEKRVSSLKMIREVCKQNLVMAMQNSVRLRSWLDVLEHINEIFIPMASCRTRMEADGDTNDAARAFEEYDRLLLNIRNIVS